MSKTKEKTEEKTEPEETAEVKSNTLIMKSKTPELWKNLIAGIKTLVEEATFDCDSEGITFRAMDPSHVALLDVHIPSKAFDKYQCKGEQKFTCRVEDMDKLFRRAEKNGSVDLTRTDNDMLALVFENGYRREFNMHLIESTYGATPLPKLSYNSKIILTNNAFRKLLEDIQVVSDHVTLETTNSKVTFNGKGDSGTGKAELSKGFSELIALNVKEDSRSTYSIDYLLNITKTIPTDKLTIEYSTKMPARITYFLDPNELSQAEFYLAPRMEEK